MTVRQIFVKIFRSFLPKKWRQYLKANFDFFDLNVYKAHTKVYGTFYLPIYNSHRKIDGTEPDIYNSDGQKLHSFFLRDNQFIVENPLVSKYFIFNRYNFELPVHFYTHDCMRQQLGSPKKRYGLLIEPRSVDWQDYRLLEKNKKLAESFDRIFTFDEKLLDELPNAYPFCYNAKIRIKKYDDVFLQNLKHHEKTKNISIVSSAKLLCDLHKLRYDWAMHFKTGNEVDTFGTFDGGGWTKMSEYLYDYRYSIIVENDIQPYWFTEKILNCFALRVVPIYVGHRNIGKIFNPDGIIFVEPKDYGNIDEIIKQCTPADYEARLSAIDDNLQRVQAYWNSYDNLYEQVIKNDLKE